MQLEVQIQLAEQSTEWITLYYFRNTQS